MVLLALPSDLSAEEGFQANPQILFERPQLEIEIGDENLAAQVRLERARVEWSEPSAGASVVELVLEVKLREGFDLESSSGEVALTSLPSDPKEPMTMVRKSVTDFTEIKVPLKAKGAGADGPQSVSGQVLVRFKPVQSKVVTDGDCEDQRVRARPYQDGEGSAILLLRCRVDGRRQITLRSFPHGAIVDFAAPAAAAAPAEAPPPAAPPTAEKKGEKKIPTEVELDYPQSDGEEVVADEARQVWFDQKIYRVRTILEKKKGSKKDAILLGDDLGVFVVTIDPEREPRSLLRFYLGTIIGLQGGGGFGISPELGWNPRIYGADAWELSAFVSAAPLKDGVTGGLIPALTGQLRAMARRSFMALRPGLGLGVQSWSGHPTGTQPLFSAIVHHRLFWPFLSQGKGPQLSASLGYFPSEFPVTYVQIGLALGF